MYFKPSQTQITPPSFVLRKHVIPAVDKCKYLGIVVSKTICDNYLKRQMPITMQTPTYYYENSVTVLQNDVNCCMFKSYCPTMYCPFMWFDSLYIYEETKNCLQQWP